MFSAPLRRPVFSLLWLSSAFLSLAACSSESPSAEPELREFGLSERPAAFSTKSTPRLGAEAEVPPIKTLSGSPYGTAVWTKMDPATVPSGSSNISMAFDSAAGVPVLFNGADKAMWTWDGVDWAKLPWPDGDPSPGNRDSEIVFDIERGRVVLYGGFRCEGGCGRHNDTWEWFGGSWTKREGVGTARNSRNSHSLVYDSIRKVTVLTGGLFGNSDTTDSDTWHYDGNSWTLNVEQDDGYLPARRQHATAFDAARGVTVLFGGADTTGGTRYSDTWEYDGTAWADVTLPSGNPGARHSHQLAYDAVRKTTVLYGGTGGVYDYDIQWEWDGTVWRRISLAGPNPGGRHSHAMVFDPVRKRVVFFGGYGSSGGISTYQSDTWEMHVRGNSCGTVDDCHTGFCVDGVCCETACDGVCEACSAAVKGFGEDGICEPIAADTDPENECAAGTGHDAACLPGTCDGAGACKVNVGISCQPAGCLDGETIQPEAVCNAAGSCEAPPGVACLADESCEDGVCVENPPDLDAGVPDDGGDDAGPIEDAGAPDDAGDDAGPIEDAGIPDDAGDDAEPIEDAEAPHDADIPSDAGVDPAPDAGDAVIPTSTVLSTDTPIIDEGEAVVVSVSVTADEGIPTGQVTLRDAELTLSTLVLDQGQATFTISLTGVGEHELVALYPGDGEAFGASTSNPLVVVVNGPSSGYDLIGGGCMHAPGGANANTGWAALGIASFAMIAARRRRVEIKGGGERGRKS